jgi:hypothetical protein
MLHDTAADGGAARWQLSAQLTPGRVAGPPSCPAGPGMGMGDDNGLAEHTHTPAAAGMPGEVVEGMRGSGMWGWFTGLAHTLP